MRPPSKARRHYAGREDCRRRPSGRIFQSLAAGRPQDLPGKHPTGGSREPKRTRSAAYPAQCLARGRCISRAARPPAPAGSGRSRSRGMYLRKICSSGEMELGTPVATSVGLPSGPAPSGPAARCGPATRRSGCSSRDETRLRNGTFRAAIRVPCGHTQSARACGKWSCNQSRNEGYMAGC